MTKDNDTDQNQGAEIVSLPAPKQASDPLLEEINVVKLEGRYFCFDLREVPKRKGVLEYQDGNRKISLELHPDYGQPSILAYRILQATFRKITLEGRPFPDTVAFTYRELSRFVGRDVWGGKDGKDIIRAIRQLQRTVITLAIDEPGSSAKRWVEFSLVVTSGFVSGGDADSPGRIKTAVLTLHPAIIDSMRRGHFVIFNWDRITALSPLSAAFYKRLYLHLSNLFENKHNKASLKFEKDYEDVCAEWLGGLQPYPYKSRIIQQLAPHLDALKQSGLLRSWAVERKADGKSYKLVFTPGAGFFLDYDLFYHGSTARVLQFQRAADEAKIHAPIELTRYFFKKLHGSEKIAKEIFSEKDVQFAEHLLRRYGVDESQALIDYALTNAQSTKFAMKTLRGVSVYLAGWEVNRDALKAHVEKAKANADKKRKEALESEYEDYLRKHTFDQLEAMQPEEREAIKQEAEESATLAVGKGAIGYKMKVGFAERKIVLDRYPAMSFDDWQKTHR